MMERAGAGRIAVLGLVAIVAVLGSLNAPPVAAQGAPKFPQDTVTLEAGPDTRHRFTVEIARTQEQRSWGLMYRRELAADHGMLFIYPRPRRVGMWMKNTYISLDMLFIGPDGRIRRIHREAEPESRETIRSGEPVKAVLEVVAGTADRLELETGNAVRHAVFGNTD